MNAKQEPILSIELEKTHITLLGTAHVSQASVEKVKELLAAGDYDAVAVELCSSRYRAMFEPAALEKMNLFEILREGKTPMVIASLALSAFQQKIAEELGIKPGAEMVMAVEQAQQKNLPILLIDREVGTTLKRVYRNISWWKRLNLLAGLLVSVVIHDKISEEEIEKLKEGDMLEAAFSQFADQNQDLFNPLIDERDRYMAIRLLMDAKGAHYRHMLAVVGAGHLKGIARYLQQMASQNQDANRAILAQLDQIPEGKRWPRIIPWLIVLIVLGGFALGFSRSPELGWRLVADWILINGSLSAIGAVLALAHPLTVLTAFLAAPLTSLNPMIGAGMVAMAVEVFLRKPNVGDFSRLRTDATHLQGWWKNRVARILLVFLFSTLGSVLGTYIAGFKIFERLFM